MHCHVVNLIALDHILRLLLRGANGIGLKLDRGGDLLPDSSADVTRSRSVSETVSGQEKPLKHSPGRTFSSPHEAPSAPSRTTVRAIIKEPREIY